MRLYLVAALLAAFLVAPAHAMPRPGATLAEACGDLSIDDACELIAEATRMLGPTYETPKRRGVMILNSMGFDVTYVPARHGRLQGTTDIFLASRPKSNRLFIIITGTESAKDWFENAKFGSYSPVYRDGQFYVPPGHAGFRRGMLNIVNDKVIRQNEFDKSLKCTGPRSDRSWLADHICLFKLPQGRKAIDAVIVGHSRGAGIGLLMATAFAGLEFTTRGNELIVDEQAAWPLDLKAVIAFSPPYAVYRMTDQQAGLPVPRGFPDHWAILQRYSLPQRAISFLDEQDIVPLLSLGLGRHFGHRFRIGRDTAITYEGFGRGLGTEGDGWGLDSDLGRAHSSHHYCQNVLRALGSSGNCPPPPEPMN